MVEARKLNGDVGSDQEKASQVTRTFGSTDDASVHRVKKEIFEAMHEEILCAGDLR
jgi:hypothetical protein